MEPWKKGHRMEVVMVDIDALVPSDHLLRKIEKVMDYDFLYQRLNPLYCPDNGRPGTDPVVLVKMVLLQHLFGIPSLRQTHQRIKDAVSYRWFLGYGFLDEIPHFATVSYALCRRFPGELAEEIFAHILNKLLNHRMVEPSMVFIDGTHIKASANKKKFPKEQVLKTAKVYAQELRQEVNEDRARLGKPPIEDSDGDDDAPPPTQEKTVSTTDPESGSGARASSDSPLHPSKGEGGGIQALEVYLRRGELCPAKREHRACVCRRQGEARHAIYAVPRPRSGDQLGEA